MKKTSTPTKAILVMNWYEAGILRGTLEKHNEFDKLPKSLQLKLNILFTKAYLDHSTTPMGKQAKKDIAKYSTALKKLKERKK